MSKKQKKGLIALAMLAAAAAIGVTLGFMFKKANAVNRFTPAKVTCTVSEKLDDTAVSEPSAAGKTKSDICVQNTGNVKEYLRLRLVSYFVDAKGNITGAEPSVFPALKLNAGWIAGTEHTYYYTKPIDPNGTTPVLCEPFTLTEKVTQDQSTVYQVVEVFAEAIQAEPESAAQETWKVTISDGIITAAP